MPARSLFLLLATHIFPVWADVAQNDATNEEDGSSRSQGPPYTTCDNECQHQVKMLEGFIALVMLGCALGVGICCIKCIDTPAVFSSSKSVAAKKRD